MSPKICYNNYTKSKKEIKSDKNMKCLVYICQDYNYAKFVTETLNKLKPVSTFNFCRYDADHIRIFREANIPFELIQKDFLYNFLREDADLTIVFHDGEDLHAVDLIQYCSYHRKNILIAPIGDSDNNASLYK